MSASAIAQALDITGANPEGRARETIDKLRKVRLIEQCGEESREGGGRRKALWRPVDQVTQAFLPSEKVSSLTSLSSFPPEKTETTITTTVFENGANRKPIPTGNPYPQITDRPQPDFKGHFSTFIQILKDNPSSTPHEIGLKLEVDTQGQLRFNGAQLKQTIEERRA